MAENTVMSFDYPFALGRTLGSGHIRIIHQLMQKVTEAFGLDKPTKIYITMTPQQE
jgi:hypothetical protein